ncbi:MAG: HTH-type transcriptional activator CmpR [Pseudomonadota bacterium]|jgi:DNA-binding transcriptional LysR family regulator
MDKNLGTLRQFELLVTVFDEGSVTRAAEKLFLTQPSVTMQLNKLQETLGIDLTYQQGRQIKFTEGGKMVVEHAKKLLTDYYDLGRRVNLLKGVEQGGLSLGMVTTAKYFIPYMVGEFSQAHPRIEFQFNLGNRQQIIERALSDRDDFYVFSHPPKDQELTTVPMLENRLVAIASIDHPFARRQTVGLEEFCEQPLLMREAGSGTRLSIEQFCAQKGIELNVRMTIDSNEAIKHTVMSGLGLGIVSEHVLSHGGSDGVAQINVEGLDISSRWYLVYRRSRPLSPAASAFLASVNPGAIL